MLTATDSFISGGQSIAIDVFNPPAPGRHPGCLTHRGTADRIVGIADSEFTGADLTSCRSRAVRFLASGL